jgi:hypothetical protein
VDAQQVIVVAPIAGRVLGPIGRAAGFLLARELQTWRNRHPGATIVVIRPNSAIARLAGRHPLALFDADRARQVYPLAVAQGLQWGERMQSATAARGWDRSPHWTAARRRPALARPARARR